mmetsp:Transcript_37460/g.47771  ORF Transcript_37460/g.47771 Transcript_37460/m.47771 type:complete len:604 (+) Transcript_37460:47-1858(+)
MSTMSKFSRLGVLITRKALAPPCLRESNLVLQGSLSKYFSTQTKPQHICADNSPLALLASQKSNVESNKQKYVSSNIKSSVSQLANEGITQKESVLSKQENTESQFNQSHSVRRGQFSRILDTGHVKQILYGLEDLIKDKVEMDTDFCENVAEKLLIIGRKRGPQLKRELGNQIFILYNHMYDHKIVPKRSFYTIYMEACAELLENSIAAEAMHTQLLEMGLVPNDKENYEQYLNSLFAAVKVTNQRNAASKEYERARSGNFLPKSRNIFEQAIELHSLQRGSSSAAASVLEDMMALGIMPSFLAVQRVLDVAIGDMNCPVLLKLMTLLQKIERPLDRGQSLAILTCAANRGDAGLAAKAWKMMKELEVEPSEPHYSSFVLAMLRNNKDREAFAFLAKMEKNGVFTHRKSIQTFGRILSRTVRRLDHAYFCVLDETSKGENASISALNAIMYGCSRKGNAALDRAFATFDDFEQTFGISPNLDTYNALISTCANPERPQAAAAFSLVKKMRESGVEPDADTFDAVVKSAFFRKQDENVKKVLQETVDLKFSPSLQTIMLLVNGYSTSKGGDTVLEILQLLASFPVPDFLKERTSTAMRSLGKS